MAALAQLVIFALESACVLKAEENATGFNGILESMVSELGDGFVHLRGEVVMAPTRSANYQ